ncbi:MAG TPA: hypothetical protein VIH53_05715 [Gemmatimonadaceae bacterium]|jgi:hypothetical protein
MKPRFISAIVLPLLIGCAQIQQLDPNYRSDWVETLSHARQAADAGNYFAADKLLDEYVRMHPGTPEASETAFWKAAYQVDPANNLGSLSGGIAALDAYLAANPNGIYRNEATVLRRTAAAAQGLTGKSLPAADSTARAVVKDTVVVESKSRDEQIAALRDQLAASKAELAKATAELDRIKKRLANPSN